MIKTRFILYGQNMIIFGGYQDMDKKNLQSS